MRALLILTVLLAGIATAADETVPNLLQQAREAFGRQQSDKAIELATQAIKLDDADYRSWAMRGQLYAALRKNSLALADFNSAIKQRDDLPSLYELRGSEQFKLGKFAESIADFDQEIKLAPQRQREHWKRGISYYYAKQYDEGRKQFEGYQTFDSNDVENAVWRFLCMVHTVGLKPAQSELLPIKNDRRIPMMQIYELFAGRGTIDQVNEAVESGQPSERELYQRRFYAHLYLGLYLEATGKRAPGAEHLRLAAEKYPIEHYMTDVARVHVTVLSGK